MQGRSQMKFSRIASLFTLAMLTIATAVPAAHALKIPSARSRKFRERRKSNATAGQSQPRRTWPSCCTIRL